MSFLEQRTWSFAKISVKNYDHRILEWVPGAVCVYGQHRVTITLQETQTLYLKCAYHVLSPCIVHTPISLRFNVLFSL